MKSLLGFILLLFVNNVNAAWEDWTREQKNWFVAANIVTLADWATTRDLSRRYHEGYREKNPFLGSTPTRSQVDRHFAVGMVLNYFLTDYLQGDTRTLYLKIYTVGEGIIVARNLRLGLELKF